MHGRQAIFFVMLVLLAAIVNAAVIKEASMPIYAVTSQGNALQADLILALSPGNGSISTKLTSLVGTSTQATMRTSVKVASDYADNWNEFDYVFDINSPASMVEGPSAGAAMALLVITQLRGQKIPSNVSLTGTVTIDGGVGPVGGVFHKAEEAARTGVDLFMIPKGEAKQIVKTEEKIENINLPSYAFEKWGLVVVEVKDIDEVLELTFSDIEDIEVAGVEEAFTVFTPQAVDESPQLQPMKDLTQKYIDEGFALTENAKNSLGTSIMEDEGLLDALLQTLNEAEKALSEAELLYSRNYLYSAANYAFIAKVNANLVKDIAENPSLLKADSETFDLRVEALKTNIKNFKEELGTSVPIDCLEWHISAKQRLTYAENSITGLETMDILSEDFDASDKYALALAKLQDLEFAEQWLNVAKDLDGFCSDSQKRLDGKKLADLNLFTDMLDQFISESEEGVTLISKEELGDALRRLDAARVEESNGWNMTAAIDSASALALINSDLIIEEMTEGTDSFDELLSLLEKKVRLVDQNLAVSHHTFIWPQLYLDHAKYYLRSAQQYSEEGQIIKGRNMAKSGLSLVFLAEYVFIAANRLNTYFEGNDLDHLAYSGETIAPRAQPGTINEVLLAYPEFSFLLISLMAVLLVVFVLVTRTLQLKLRKMHSHDILWQIQQNKRLQKKLDMAFANHKVSRPEYNSMMKDFESKLRKLQNKRIDKAKQLLKLDELNSDTLALNHMLRDLKHRLLQGIITEEEYQRAVEETGKRSAEVTQEITLTKSDIEKGQPLKVPKVSSVPEPFGENPDELIRLVVPDKPAPKSKAKAKPKPAKPKTKKPIKKTKKKKSVKK